MEGKCEGPTPTDICGGRLTLGDRHARRRSNAMTEGANGEKSAAGPRCDGCVTCVPTLFWVFVLGIRFWLVLADSRFLHTNARGAIDVDINRFGGG